MDELLKQVLTAPGISGSEGAIAALLKKELEKHCDGVEIDKFGNVVGRKGSGPKKIMIAAHMDEIGLMVKHVSKEGFIRFIKIGGIDDRVLVGQRVVIKARGGDIVGIIGTKPPHLQKDEERKKPIKYEDMFIDIGSKDKEETLRRVTIGDQIIFEPNAGVLNGDLCYGKAIDNRVGCYALLKVMEKLGAIPGASVFAVMTTQEEVGLKGGRTAAFAIDPDFALALDTTIAGDTPGISENESSLKLGDGVAVTIIEASGRGTLVPENIKNLIIDAARQNNIKFQLDVIEGGMTDGAVMHITRGGIRTGVLSIPTRYIHAPTGVFSAADVISAADLAVRVVEKVAAES